MKCRVADARAKGGNLGVETVFLAQELEDFPRARIGAHSSAEKCISESRPNGFMGNGRV